MRPLASLAVALRLGLCALVPAVVVGLPTEAAADAKSDARMHYQAGVKFYSQGDYKSAIREFSAAQQLYPADLNNYNLALCYDKLGDPEPAIQYYRAFLDKQPSTDKKAEITASISRLEAAQARVVAKREAEAKKAEEKRLAAEARAAEAAAKQAAAEQKKLAEQARVDEEKRRKEAAKQPPVTDPDPALGPDEPSAPGPTGVGSTGTPSTGTTVSTGDAQLDRVSSIDINAIRDQRVGGAASGLADPSAGPGGPAVAANGAAGAGPSDPQEGGRAAATPAAPADQPKAKPVYTKWWFWVIVGVGAYVLYQVASEPEDEEFARTRTMPLMTPGGGGAAAAPGGYTLMRW